MLNLKPSWIFISNTNIRKAKGGWDGLGFKIFELLERNYEINLLDNIDPKLSIYSKISNKIIRILGFKSNFHFFSNRRLKKIASIFSEQQSNKNSILFFHGSTPWSLINPGCPYFVLLDCTFKNYISVYHDDSLFSESDLKRIGFLDKRFLLSAEKVFFTSNYALNEAINGYNLVGDNFINIGQGPGVEFVESEYDSSIKKKQLLFVASDFLGKGGLTIFNAFTKFSNFYPDYKLIVVGQRPPTFVLSNDNVVYMGYIDKSNEDGLNLLSRLYSESWFLLLLSTKDIAPLVLIDAGMLYCPSISLNTGAVDELIVDCETGYILKSNTVECLFNVLISAAEQTQLEYDKLCVNVYDYMVNNHNWKLTEKKLVQSINESIQK